MNHVRPAITLFALLSIITGVAYPFMTTAMGQALFPYQSNGSLIYEKGQVIGSVAIGQTFSSPRYFWGRLSATTPMPYNGSASGGSNFAPTNPALLDAAKDRIAALKTADPDNTLAVPIDLITASASGLDPHISPEAALYQASRVAKSRHIDPNIISNLIETYTELPKWHLFGQARVNVLELNHALDTL